MRSLSTVQRKQQAILWVLFIGLFFAMLLNTEYAFAGTKGTPFAGIWKMLTGWIQGYLGRVICGAMILVGVVAGIARQSLMSFAVGIAAGLGLYNLPGIVNGIMTARLPVMNQLETLLISLGSGLN